MFRTDQVRPARYETVQPPPYPDHESSSLWMHVKFEAEIENRKYLEPIKLDRQGTRRLNFPLTLTMKAHLSRCMCEV